jgi:putative ubiquitin-RnfH superfamily antitoxin RatB of RatAB toxin-antitoxin module
MQVAIAYGEPDQQIWLQLEVPEGSTVADVIQRSGLLERCPGIDLTAQKVGIFGKFTKLEASVKAGDRVEIYRPITADPKTTPRRKTADDDDDD